MSNYDDPIVIDDQGNIVSGNPHIQGQKVILPAIIWPAAWLGTLFTVLHAAKEIIGLQAELREILNDFKDAQNILEELRDLLIKKCKKS